jgi:hypothetical protein
MEDNELIWDIRENDELLWDMVQDPEACQVFLVIHGHTMITG